MSDLAPYDQPGSVTLTQDELKQLIAEHVKDAVAQQFALGQGVALDLTPEQHLDLADLPVTPEVAGLLKHVPAERRAHLLSTHQLRTAILKGRPATEIATILDAANGYSPHTGGGPATASLARSAA